MLANVQLLMIPMHWTPMVCCSSHHTNKVAWTPVSKLRRNNTRYGGVAREGEKQGEKFVGEGRKWRVHVATSDATTLCGPTYRPDATAYRPTRSEVGHQ